MATRPLPEAAAGPLLAPYIEELHEFLATNGLPFGSPADLAAVTDRLRQPGPFSDDLCSLLRSFVLRQGGVMPHAQLLEILTLAIAGPETATNPQYSEPLRQLLAFVAGVMRRPWNRPPGEPAEIVPFPTNTAARATDVAAEPIAPPPSATHLAESRRISPPPEQPSRKALPSEPVLFLRSIATPLPDLAAAVPLRLSTLLHDLLIATAGAVALGAVLVLADHARKPAGDYRVGSLLTNSHKPASQRPPTASTPPGQIPQPLFFTGTTHPPKPSAYGAPLQAHPAHHSRTPALTLTYSEPNPPDSAASPTTSAQPAPTGTPPPSPSPAESSQPTASPVSVSDHPNPTR
jgi:hypothetical protein